MIRKPAARRVLVVDDEPSVREMLSDFLEMNNFICMQAENGETAVDVSRREKPDLVILDVRMPGVSGMEALREIKLAHPDQPVIMVTAVSEVETAVEAMRLGASDYVIKPFVLHDMLAIVDHAMTHDRSLAAPLPDGGPEAPMTVAVGIPMSDESDPEQKTIESSEVELLAAEIRAVQRQLATIARKVENLGRKIERRPKANASRQRKAS